MAALENNSIQQEYADTCAIKSQQLILKDLVNCWQKLVSHVLKR